MRGKPTRTIPAARGAREAAPSRGEPLSLFLAEPGLSDLTFQELKFLKMAERKARPTRFHLRNHDLIAVPGHLTDLKTGFSRLCTNVLRAPLFGRSNFGPRKLDEVAALFRRGGFRRLVGMVSGEAFHRPDLMHWLKGELVRRGVRIEESGRALWLVAAEDHFYFCEEVQNHHDAPGRGDTQTRSGALPPVIGAAMAFAAQLGRKETIWEPVAGSGNLLTEVLALAPDAQVLATEIEPQAVSALEQRFRGHPKLWIKQEDAASVRLPASGVSLTIANLPFGVRYEARGGNAEFYAAVLANSLKHAAPAWRGIFLTSDREAMLEAARRNGLPAAKVAEIKVRGMKAVIWKLERGKRA